MSFYIRWLWCIALCLLHGQWPPRLLWRWPALQCDEADMAMARASLARPDVAAALARLEAQ